MLGSIILLALAAAVYPQLLAVVVIILTRPNPQPLLWACYLTSLVVSVAGGVVIFAVFQSRESIAGTSSNRLGPAAYLVFGAIALLVAILVASRRGRAFVDRRRPRSTRPARRPRPGSAALAGARTRAEQSLSEGSLVVACLVGAVLAVPGPFDFLAFGRLATHGYGLAVAACVVVVFALIKLVLIEVPIAAYKIDPDRTAARVGRFSSWMHANKIAGVAAVVGLVGVLLIAEGVSRLG
jgi:Sap, sulfolipid-1-addressing protein